MTAIDLDTGNNARLTYWIVGGSQLFHHRQGDNSTIIAGDYTKSVYTDNDNISELFGIFPNNGWIYLRRTLDRESCELYDITVLASDNGTPPRNATTHIIVNVLDANDNDPTFSRDSYEFTVEENVRRSTIVGTISAADADLDLNAEIRYNLIPNNTSFHINPNTG